MMNVEKELDVGYIGNSPVFVISVKNCSKNRKLIVKRHSAYCIFKSPQSGPDIKIIYLFTLYISSIT